MSITWEELKGNTTVDFKEAEKFLKWWFNKDDIVAIRAIPNDGPIYTMADKRDDLIEMLNTENDEGVISLQEISNDQSSLYFNVCHVKEVKQKSKKHGITGADIKGHRGLFLDLDMKTGAFESHAQLMEWVRGLEHQPGAIVYTGAEGGVHLYWKTANLKQKDYKAIQNRWWSYHCTLAPEGVSIDRLSDPTRIMRLPGATRIPKHIEPASRVVVEYTGADPIDGEVFTKLTETPYKHYREEVKKGEQKEEQILESIGSNAPATIGQLALRDALISRTADLVSWTEILEGAGWTFLKTASNGADYWMRPGGNGKSASVNYPDERSGMALHSTDEGTGLADLKDEEIKLSKWRVFLRLTHNDDVRAAELDILEREVRSNG